MLIVRPSALGDVARSVCLAHSIKRAHPGCVVDWLVQAGFEPVLEASPSVDRLIPFDRRGLSLGRVFKGTAWWREFRSLIRALRHEKYDAVIDAQGLMRSAIFTRLTRAKTRVGYAKPTEPVRWAYSRVPRSETPVHTVDRMLQLLEPIGVEPVPDLSLVAPPRGVEEAAAAGDGWAQRFARFAVLAPTSRWASKLWPMDRWTELCERVLDSDPTIGVALTGAPGERDQCASKLERFAGEQRVLDCVGSLSLAGTMGLIGRSSLVVANDSAPLHLAVGLGVRSVGLFGPTDPALVGPYGETATVVQGTETASGNRHRESGMDDRFMRSIDVDAVFEACARVLAPAPEGVVA